MLTSCALKDCHEVACFLLDMQLYAMLAHAKITKGSNAEVPELLGHSPSGRNQREDPTPDGVPEMKLLGER
jgi:hypothetical protein